MTVDGDRRPTGNQWFDGGCTPPCTCVYKPRWPSFDDRILWERTSHSWTERWRISLTSISTEETNRARQIWKLPRRQEVSLSILPLAVAFRKPINLTLKRCECERIYEVTQANIKHRVQVHTSLTSYWCVPVCFRSAVATPSEHLSCWTPTAHGGHVLKQPV